MPRSHYPVGLVCAVMLTLGTLGCHHSGSPSLSDAANGSTDAAQQEFVQAFLGAHDRKDLAAQEKLVDWDDVTEYSRDHFVRETLQYNLSVKISSAKIGDIPGLNPNFAARYNIPPEKFFVIVYDDPRGVITIKYPIGKKDGRYYFAMFGLTPEAMQRKAKQLLNNKK